MAIVHTLGDGRRRQVAVRTLILHEDHGLQRDNPPLCSTPPDMRVCRTKKGAIPPQLR